MRVMATGLRFPEGPVWLAVGSVALVEIARGTVTVVAPTRTRPGARKMFARTRFASRGLAA